MSIVEFPDVPCACGSVKYTVDPGGTYECAQSQCRRSLDWDRLRLVRGPAAAVRSATKERLG